MTVAGRVLRNSTFQGADALVSGLLGVIMAGALARYLGSEGYGKYALVMAFVPLFQIVAEWGIDQVALREISRRREEAGKIVGNVVLLKLVPALAAVALCWLALAAVSYPPDVTIAAQIYSLFLLAHAIGTVSLVFSADLRSEYLVLSDIVATTLNFLLLLAIIHSTGGLPAIFMAAVIAVAVREGLGYHFARRYVAIDYRLDRSLCRELLSQTPMFGVNRALSAGSGSIMVLLLSKLGTQEALGFYGAAARLPIMLLYIPTILTASLFPLLAGRYGTDPVGLHRLHVRGMEFLLMAVLPFAVGGWLLADRLISTIFGGAFSEAVPVFQVLMAQWIFLSVGMLVSQTLVAANCEHVVGWVSVLIAGGLLIGGLVAIPLGGALGAALAAAAVYALAMVAGLVVLAGRLGGFARGSRLWRIFLAVGALVPFLAAIGSGPIFLVIPAAVLLYGATLVAVRAISPMELRLALVAATRRSGQ